MWTPSRNVAWWLVPKDWLSLLFYKTQGWLSKGSTVHSAMGLSVFIINQENAPQTCQETSLVGAFLDVRLPLSR